MPIQLDQRFDRLHERALLFVPEVVYGATQSRGRPSESLELLREVYLRPRTLKLQVEESQRLQCAREVLEHDIVQIPGYPATFGLPDLPKRLLGPTALGDVVLNSHEVHHAVVLVPNRVDAELVVEQGPVLTVIPKHHGAMALLADRSPELFERRLVPILALQKAAVAA